MRVKKYNVQHKRDKKKSEIIQASAQLFMEKGFENVTLSDIAGTNNLGRTTVYEYFNNKNEILAAYLEKEMTAYHEKVMVIMNKKEALRNKLKLFMQLQLEYGDYHKSFSQLFRSLSRSSKDISAETEATIIKKHHEIYAALTKEFDTAVRRKEIRALPLALVIQLLINATSLPVRSGKDPKQTAEEVLSVFWSGISIK